MSVTATPATVPPLAVPAEAAARLCGCGRSKWYALHAQGLVPDPVHVGKRPLWRVAELDAWMQAGCPNREDWEAHKAQAQRRGGASMTTLTLPISIPVEWAERIANYDETLERLHKKRARGQLVRGVDEWPDEFKSKTMGLLLTVLQEPCRMALRERAGAVPVQGHKDGGQATDGSLLSREEPPEASADRGVIEQVRPRGEAR